MDPRGMIMAKKNFLVHPSLARVWAPNPKNRFFCKTLEANIYTKDQPIFTKILGILL